MAHGVPQLPPSLPDIPLPSSSSTPYSMPGLSPDIRTEQPLTPAERERQETLLKDGYVRILDPHNVQCLLCHKNIKLSTKSNYDLFHWRNHRARCLRAMKKKLKTSEAVKRSPHLSALSARTVTRKRVRQAKHPKTPTSPLVTDSEDDRLSDLSPKVESSAALRSPSTLCFPPPLKTYVVCEEPSLEEYMLRPYPECVQTMPRISHGHNWSWAQLKQRPHFAAPVYYDDGDDGNDGEGTFTSHSTGRGVVGADEREQEAAQTLSTLFRSR